MSFGSQFSSANFESVVPPNERLAKIKVYNDMGHLEWSEVDSSGKYIHKESSKRLIRSNEDLEVYKAIGNLVESSIKNGIMIFYRKGNVPLEATVRVNSTLTVIAKFTFPSRMESMVYIK